MDAPRTPEPEGSAGFLGDVLYAGRGKPSVPESEWVALVQMIAVGDQVALHALYDRANRLVFTLIVRIVANRETAEELTLDVFHEVWRRAADYDAANGTVLGWILNQARSRALDRLRFDRRKKRVQPDDVEDPLPVIEVPDPSDLAAFREQSRALRCALSVLTPEERITIETAFFAELTHAE